MSSRHAPAARAADDGSQRATTAPANGRQWDGTVRVIEALIAVSELSMLSTPAECWEKWPFMLSKPNFARIQVQGNDRTLVENVNHA